MPLSPGPCLGPYELLAPLGAGGMGKVYPARDRKFGRDVALKVLPAAFAGDAERMALFQREAQVLASLNHPNIAAIYGLEESQETRTLVMELVEGPTLAERIRQGPMPPDEALPIARQMAEALEYAHEKGIVHRDLKPANVKVTADGNMKVLDFGLAKALADSPEAADIANSPTLSIAATKAGGILGTAAYMPPEQAKGKTVDRRADIWAFGVLLYEMLRKLRRSQHRGTVSENRPEKEPPARGLLRPLPARRPRLRRDRPPGLCAPGHSVCCADGPEPAGAATRLCPTSPGCGRRSSSQTRLFGQTSTLRRTASASP